MTAEIKTAKTVSVKCLTCNKTVGRKVRLTPAGELKREIIDLGCTCGGRVDFTEAVKAKYDIEPETTVVEVPVDIEPETAEPEMPVVESTETPETAEPEAALVSTDEPEAEESMTVVFTVEFHGEVAGVPEKLDVTIKRSGTTTVVSNDILGSCEFASPVVGDEEEMMEADVQAVESLLADHGLSLRSMVEKVAGGSTIVIDHAVRKTRTKKDSPVPTVDPDKLSQNLHVRVRTSLGAEQEARRNGDEMAMTGVQVIELMGGNKVSIPAMAKACGCSESRIRNIRYYGIKTEAEVQQWREAIKSLSQQ